MHHNLVQLSLYIPTGKNMKLSVQATTMMFWRTRKVFKECNMNNRTNKVQVTEEILYVFKITL